MNRPGPLSRPGRDAGWLRALGVLLVSFAALPIPGQVAVDDPDHKNRPQSGAGALLSIAPDSTPPIPSTPSSSPLGSDQTTGDIRDIRGPVSIPNPWLPYLIVAGVAAALALIALSVFLFRRYRKRRPMAPVISPYDQALNDLRATRSLMADGRDKEFSIAVSAAVRYFLERQFSIPAPESTTEEFLIRIHDHDLMKGKLSDTFCEFLQQCDLAKFAQQAFGLHGMKALYGKAEVLIEETYLKHKMRAAVLADDPSAKPG